MNAIENFSPFLQGLLEAQEPGDGSSAAACCWEFHQRGCLICLQEPSPVSAYLERNDQMNILLVLLTWHTMKIAVFWFVTCHLVEGY